MSANFKAIKCRICDRHFCIETEAVGDGLEIRCPHCGRKFTIQVSYKYEGLSNG